MGRAPHFVSLDEKRSSILHREALASWALPAGSISISCLELPYQIVRPAFTRAENLDRQVLRLVHGRAGELLSEELSYRGRDNDEERDNRQPHRIQEQHDVDVGRRMGLQ